MLGMTRDRGSRSFGAGRARHHVYGSFIFRGSFAVGTSTDHNTHSINTMLSGFLRVVSRSRQQLTSTGKTTTRLRLVFVQNKRTEPVKVSLSSVLELGWLLGGSCNHRFVGSLKYDVLSLKEGFTIRGY